MSAIYQQARPVTFGQVIGQEHVKDVLMAALKRGRIGHAYLFSGPRGVGKTTTARLVAMAVNCEREEKPCGECESCLLVRAGNHPDVTELDAASNNSVDDIRDLREKVRLASMRGGRRVWVLDEAHMLSRAASNALLKTLEEPPEGLVFVLATTEPEKLPPTILSRCQHFRFRRLSEEEICGKLAALCKQAEVEADDAALSLVARAADGAMRDGESLLERLLASGERITVSAAEDALGLPPQDQMRALASQLVGSQLGNLLSSASQLYHAGFAPSSLAEHLTRVLRDALASSVLADGGFTLDIPQNDLLRVIHALDDEQERFSKRDNLFALELSLIKALNVLGNNGPSGAVAAPSQVPTTSAPPAARPAATASSLPDFDPTGRPPAKPAPQYVPPPQADVSTPKPPETKASSSAPNLSWHAIKTKADAQLKAFLMPAQDNISGNTITLTFEDRHKFHFGQLKTRQDELMKLIVSMYGDGVSLSVHGPGDSFTKKA